MEISQEFVVTLALWVAGGLLAIICALVAVLWAGINKKLDRTEALTMERLKTLGHEDRAIRDQINGILMLLTEYSSEKSVSTEKENKQLRWMLEEYSKMYEKKEIEVHEN